MKQRGRKSTEGLVVNGPGESLPPPASLTDEERGVWHETVDGKPSDYFGSEQGPLLVSYVSAVCRGRVIKRMLQEHLDGADKSEEWRREFKALNQMADRSTMLIQSLSTSMRLTHQSVYRADKVIPKKGKRLWQREAEPRPN